MKKVLLFLSLLGMAGSLRADGKECCTSWLWGTPVTCSDTSYDAVCSSCPKPVVGPPTDMDCLRGCFYSCSGWSN